MTEPAKPEERCPQCGSDKRDFRRTLEHETAGASNRRTNLELSYSPCSHPWHSPEAAQLNCQKCGKPKFTAHQTICSGMVQDGSINAMFCHCVDIYNGTTATEPDPRDERLQELEERNGVLEESTIALAQCGNELAEKAEAAEAERDRLVEALRNLVTKLKAMEKPLNGCLVVLHAHGMAYSGPNWGEEMTVAESVLSAYDKAAPSTQQGTGEKK